MCIIHSIYNVWNIGFLCCGLTIVLVATACIVHVCNQKRNAYLLRWRMLHALTFQKVDFTLWPTYSHYCFYIYCICLSMKCVYIQTFEFYTVAYLRSLLLLHVLHMCVNEAPSAYLKLQTPSDMPNQTVLVKLTAPSFSESYPLQILLQKHQLPCTYVVCFWPLVEKTCSINCSTCIYFLFSIFV